ncbi:unnamed protein product [Urochloa humidicola]
MAVALAVTDEVALPIRAVGDLAAAADVSREEVAIITQCASLSGKLPFDDGSVGAVLTVIKNVEGLRKQLLAEIHRVLKAGGRVLVQSSAPSFSQKVQAKKASWSMGSSFPHRPCSVNTFLRELIDEDSLLSEEDLKKPQVLAVGATRKPCKNCTCGRAAAEAKVEKLELTAEQINNPQSDCGSCGLGDAFRCGTCPYEVSPHSSLARRFPCLATSLPQTYDGIRFK